MVHEYWNSWAKLFIVSFDILFEFLYLKTNKEYLLDKKCVFLNKGVSICNPDKSYENVPIIYLNVKINSNYKELVSIKLCTKAITSSIVTESL